MDPVLGLSVGRIVIGVVSIASPTLAARLFGLSPADNPQMGFFTRLFGVREIALGGLTLLAKGDARRTMVLAGMAVDGADAGTGAVALSRKEVPPLAGGMMIAVALSAVGSGGAALAQARTQSQT